MKIRKPFLSILMTEREAHALLRLLDGIDREGYRVDGHGDEVKAYDRVATRIRHAEVRFPFSGRGRQSA